MQEPEIFVEIENRNCAISNYGRLRRYLKDGRYYYTLGTLQAERYRKVTLRNVLTKKWKTYYMHVLVAKAFLENPNNLPTVDHIDNDKSNNHYKNLRFASHTTQSQNRKKYKTKTDSKFSSVMKGVVTRGKKFTAQITINKQTIYLGKFKTEEEAGRAWDRKCLEIYGELANLNFPVTDYLVPDPADNPYQIVQEPIAPEEEPKIVKDRRFAKQFKKYAFVDD
jgi:hypothetical protein